MITGRFLTEEAEKSSKFIIAAVCGMLYLVEGSVEPIESSWKRLKIFKEVVVKYYLHPRAT